MDMPYPVAYKVRFDLVALHPATVRLSPGRIDLLSPRPPIRGSIRARARSASGFRSGPHLAGGDEWQQAATSSSIRGSGSSSSMLASDSATRLLGAITFICCLVVFLQ